MIEFNHSWLSLKKQKKYYERNKHLINEIYEMYWQTITVLHPKILNGIVHLERKQKFKWKVTEIINYFKLNSVIELHFLVAQDFRADLEKPIARWKK